MSETRSPLTILRLCNIDVVGGMKHLRLRTLIDLVIVKAELPTTPEPGIVNQQRRCPVVAVTVNRPMGQYKVWMLAFQYFPKVCVSSLIDLSIAVDLAGEGGPSF